VEYDANHDESGPFDFVGRNHCPDQLDIALLEQPLRAPVARRRADVRRLRQFRIRKPPVALQQAQHFQVDFIEIAQHERFFHEMEKLWKKMSIYGPLSTNRA